MRRSVIVCPADGSAGTRAAIAQAATLARLRHAELHLLHVLREEGRRGVGKEEEVHPVLAHALQSTLDAVRGRGQHIRFRIKAQRGRPESVIADYGRRHRAALIVISAGFGGRRSARGSVARGLGRSGPCPALVVTATTLRRNARIPGSFHEVVCAVNLTSASVSALHAFGAFARGSSGRLTLVHAVGDTSVPRRLLRLVPRVLSKPYRVWLIVGSGRPDRLIVDTAAEIEADLIVLGVPRRTRLDELVGGSTSRAVLRRARVPVLLVPGSSSGGR